MSSLGAMLTQQWLAGLRQQTADKQNQIAQQRQNDQQAFDRLITTQQVVAKQQQDEHKRQFELAKMYGEAAQLAGVEAPKFASGAENDAVILGNLVGKAQQKERQTKMSDEVLLNTLRSQGQAANSAALENTRHQNNLLELAARDQSAARRQEDQQAFEASQNTVRENSRQNAAQNRAELQVETPIKRKAEETMIFNIDPTLRRMGTVKDQYQGFFSNPAIQQAVKLGGGFEKWGVNLLPEQRRAFESLQAQVKDVVNSYVKSQTGMARSDKEYEVLKQVLPDMDVNPTAFKARLDAFVKALNEDRSALQNVLSTGGAPRESPFNATFEGSTPTVASIPRGNMTLNQWGDAMEAAGMPEAQIKDALRAARGK